jgi:hypothetical protein
MNREKGSATRRTGSSNGAASSTMSDCGAAWAGGDAGDFGDAGFADGDAAAFGGLDMAGCCRRWTPNREVKLEGEVRPKEPQIRRSGAHTDLIRSCPMRKCGDVLGARILDGLAPLVLALIAGNIRWGAGLVRLELGIHRCDLSEPLFWGGRRATPLHCAARPQLCVQYCACIGFRGRRCSAPGDGLASVVWGFVGMLQSTSDQR